MSLLRPRVTFPLACVCALLGVTAFVPARVALPVTPAPSIAGVPTAGDVESLLLREDFVAAMSASVARLDLAARTLGPTAAETIDRLVEVGRVTYLAGDNPTSARICSTALAEARAVFDTDDPRLAKALLYSGLVARLRRQHARARSLIEEGLAIVEPQADRSPSLVAALIQARANWLRRHDADAAVEEYRRAHELRLRHPQVPAVDRLDGLVWLAWNLNETGRPQEARPLVNAAVEGLRWHGLERHSLAGICFNLQADLAAREGDWSRAAAFLEQGADVLSALMRRVPPGYPRFKATPMGYKQLAWSHLREGRHEPAWEAVQRETEAIPAHFRSLARWSRVDPSGYRTAKRLRSLWGAAERRLRRARRTGGSLWRLAGPDLLAWLESRARIAALEQEYTDRIEVEPFGLAELQRSLAPDEAYVAYELFTTPEPDGAASAIERWAYVVRKDRLEWIKLSWDEVEQETFVMQLHWAAEWPIRVDADPENDALGRDLGRDLVDPLLPHLDGVRRVIVELSKPVPRVPIAVIPLAGGDRFGERFTVAYARSARTFFDLKKYTEPAQRLAERPVLVVGDPLSSSAPRADRSSGAIELPTLSYVSTEIETLEQLFPKMTVLRSAQVAAPQILDPDAGESLSDFGVVHLATHVVYPDRLRRALALAGDGTTPEGLLFPEQVRLGLSFDAELVTLSGCKSISNLGHNETASPDGFDLAFLGAGARRVVVSVWAMDDQASALLMDRFYRNLVDGSYTSAEALSEAKTWLRDYADETGNRPFVHPAYWAGFIHVGPDV